MGKKRVIKKKKNKITDKCDGDGKCLLENDFNEYYKNPKIYCMHKCMPVKCKNFELCNRMFPEMYAGCWGGKGCCRNCDMFFGAWNGGKGILEFSENMEECFMCLKTKILVSLPKCNHKVCIDCLKNLYYSEENEYDDNDNIIKEGYNAPGKCPLCSK